MQNLTMYNLLEVATGAFFLWTGLYLLSRDPRSILSWIIFGFIAGFSLVIIADSIMIIAPDLNEYIKWQKITDWPLFLSPIFCFHAALLTTKKWSKSHRFFLLAGYIIALLFYLIDIHGGLILKENISRLEDYKRFDGFAPGILLIPSISIVSSYLLATGILFLGSAKQGLHKFLLPAIGSLFSFPLAIFGIISFYVYIPPANLILVMGMACATFLFVYPMIRYHIFNPLERIIFDGAFLYRSVAMLIIIFIYLFTIWLSGIDLSYNTYVACVLVLIAVLSTHSFYDWLSTFINDLIYNASSGLSIVSDEEVLQALKDYNRPERLESSTLSRLKIVNQKLHSDDAKTPVDAIRAVVKEAIQYFKSEEDVERRVKKNLKYHLLRMLAIDQAEEGQILWELGFDEYPVSIMTRETKNRPPMYRASSPSEYTYTSRNAYIALKKEAIHDVTWRISYLEKMAK